MKRMLLAGASLALLASPCAAAPLEAYGKLPTVEDIQISPDGARLALLVTDGENRSVLVERTSDMARERQFNAGAQKVRRLQWAGSDHLLVTTSKAGAGLDVESQFSEWSMTVDCNLLNGRMNGVLTSNNSLDPRANNIGGVPMLHMNVIAGVPMVRTIDGKPEVFVGGVRFVNNVGQISLFSFNPRSGSDALQEDGVSTTQDWLVDADGHTLAEADFAPQTSQWTLKIKRGGDWVVAMKVSGLDPPSVEGLGREEDRFWSGAVRTHSSHWPR